MNPFFDRPSKLSHSSPSSSKAKGERSKKNSIQPPATDSGRIAQHKSELDAQERRKQPIPPPSHPRQYRAIGLIQGKYQHLAGYLTRGSILTQEGRVIDAVLLGRVISLIKKHLDLTKSHLWVVYPRNQQDSGDLHLQIVGVWEPETLAPELTLPDDTTEMESGYFSIRGEVIFSNTEKQLVIIKIKQAPKKEREKPKSFKLHLKGILPDRPVGRFWELQVQFKDGALIIQKATDFGLVKKQQKTPMSKKPVPKKYRTMPSTVEPRGIKRKSPEELRSFPPRNLLPKPSLILRKKDQKNQDQKNQEENP